MRMENENGVGRFEFGLPDWIPSRTQTLFPWRPAHSSYYAVSCHARPYLARPWPRGANGTGWNDGSGSAPCSPGSAEVWQREKDDNPYSSHISAYTAYSTHTIPLSPTGPTQRAVQPRPAAAAASNTAIALQQSEHTYIHTYLTQPAPFYHMI